MFQLAEVPYKNVMYITPLRDAWIKANGEEGGETSETPNNQLQTAVFTTHKRTRGTNTTLSARDNAEHMKKLVLLTKTSAAEHLLRDDDVTCLKTHSS